MRKDNVDKNALLQELWLSSFNEYLVKNNAITQSERLKMNEKIARYVSRLKKVSRN